MQIWPAIDLRGGKCVRLVQGDFDRETIFGDDPAATACSWVDQGAERIHLVDLDGAREGRPQNTGSVQSILDAVDVPCQLGGGIRDEPTIAEWLERGITQLVLGTSATERPEWFRGMCRKYPGRLALGLDARAGFVATDGWCRTSETSAGQLAKAFHGEPVAALVYTDIAADGMLRGPNVDDLARLVAESDLPVIASGGVTTADDVARLAEIPVAGCIIGRALYEGQLRLADAIQAAK